MYFKKFLPEIHCISSKNQLVKKMPKKLQIRHGSTIRSPLRCCDCLLSTALPLTISFKHISIRTRLYLALFATVLLVTLVLLFFLQLSRSSFQSFLADMDARLLQRVASDLELGFARADTPDWEFLQGNLSRNLRGIGPEFLPGPGFPASIPAVAGQAGEPMRPPPFGRRQQSLDPTAGYPPPPQSPLDSRLVLRDAVGRIVAGSSTSATPVATRSLFLDATLIGTLELLPEDGLQPVPPGPPNRGLPFDAPYRSDYESTLLGGSGFLTMQTRIFLALALVSVLVVLLLGLPLTRHLTRRIDALCTAASRLGEGDFSARIGAGGNDELDRLATSFDHLAEVLQKNKKSQQLWVTNISHELRTPLGILKGELEAVQDGVREADAAQIALFCAEVEQLNRLINDLFVLSMSDLGGLGYRKMVVELQPIIDDTLSRFQDRMQDKQLRLETNREQWAGLRVYGDSQRLLQLLSNLVENSINYTAAGGIIRITTHAGSHTIDIRFDDSAPGISDEHLPHLFERFFRTDESRSRNLGGAGLGLALCRSIAEAHQGRIAATHSALGGLCIILTLPRQP